MNTSRPIVVANLVAAKIGSIFGYITGTFWLFALIMIITGAVPADAKAFFAFLMLLMPSIFLVLFCRYISKQIARFKACVWLISSQHMTSIPALAAATGKTSDFVRRDLLQMIRYRYFAEAAIDMRTDTIAIGWQAVEAIPYAARYGAIQPRTASVQYVVQMPQPPAQPLHQQPEFVTVTCPGCGAVNVKQKDLPGCCQYCRSFI